MITEKSIFVCCVRARKQTSTEEDFSVVGPDAEQRGVLVGGMTRELVAYFTVEAGIAISRSHLYKHAADRCAFRYSHLVNGLLELRTVVVGVEDCDVYLD